MTLETFLLLMVAVEAGALFVVAMQQKDLKTDMLSRDSARNSYIRALQGRVNDADKEITALKEGLNSTAQFIGDDVKKTEANIRREIQRNRSELFNMITDYTKKALKKKSKKKSKRG